MQPDRRIPVATTTLLSSVGVAALYFIGTQIGLLLTPETQAPSVVWPPNALLLAVLLLSPTSRWGWYLAAVLPVHVATQLWYGFPLATIIGWYLTNVGEAVIGAYWLRRLRPTHEVFETLGGFGLFLLVAVVAATGLTSFLDAAVVVWSGLETDYWAVMRLRFVSNALATLTIVPAVVSVSVTRFEGFRGNLRACVEASGLVVGTLIAVTLIVSRLTVASSPSMLLYGVLPMLFWAAVRFGPSGVSILQFFAASAILGAALHYRVLTVSDTWSMQVLLAMQTVLSLTLAVVVRESRRLHSLHAAVLRSMSSAVAIIDPRGVVIETNEAWSAPGRRPHCRFEGVSRHANYLDRYRPERDGSIEAVTLLDGVRSVLSGTKLQFEMECVCMPEGQTRYFLMTVVPLHGEQRGAVITSTDITERKRIDAETQKVRDELAHAGRVMTMGMLSASLTHELSQPLSVVLANAQVAKRIVSADTAGDSELDAILTDVVAASSRAAGIIRRLRNWFKHAERESQLLSMNDVVSEVIALLHGDVIRRGVTLVSRLAVDLPPVSGDRVQLQQVVLNLVLNACDAVGQVPPDDRQIIVTTSSSERRVELFVEDTGAGFSPEQLGAVFEPFAATQPAGLGVGLALCHAIVREHNGELTVANNDGRGATICCSLPIASVTALEIPA